MELSARNQLKGTIKQIVPWCCWTGEVIVDVGGGQTMTSSISLSSIRFAWHSRLATRFVVVVKATDAMNRKVGPKRFIA